MHVRSGFTLSSYYGIQHGLHGYVGRDTLFVYEQLDVKEPT